MKRARKIAHVQQARILTGGQFQQPRNRLQPADSRELADVPLHDGFHIIAIPVTTTAPRRPALGLRVTALEQSLGQRRAQAAGVRQFQSTREQFIQKGGLRPG